MLREWESLGFCKQASWTFKLLHIVSIRPSWASLFSGAIGHSEARGMVGAASTGSSSTEKRSHESLRSLFSSQWTWAVRSVSGKLCKFESWVMKNECWLEALKSNVSIDWKMCVQEKSEWDWKKKDVVSTKMGHLLQLLVTTHSLWDHKNNGSEPTNQIDYCRRSWDRYLLLSLPWPSGKSMLATRYISGTFSPDGPPTIGTDFFAKRTILDGKEYDLQIWVSLTLFEDWLGKDTSGQEKFGSALTSGYYRWEFLATQLTPRSAKGCLLVYSIDSTSSFKNLSKWLIEVTLLCFISQAWAGSVYHRASLRAGVRWKQVRFREIERSLPRRGFRFCKTIWIRMDRSFCQRKYKCHWSIHVTRQNCTSKPIDTDFAFPSFCFLYTFNTKASNAKGTAICSTPSNKYCKAHSSFPRQRGRGLLLITLILFNLYWYSCEYKPLSLTCWFTPRNFPDLGFYCWPRARVNQNGRQQPERSREEHEHLQERQSCEEGNGWGGTNLWVQRFLPTRDAFTEMAFW